MKFAWQSITTSETSDYLIEKYDPDNLNQDPDTMYPTALKITVLTNDSHIVDVGVDYYKPAAPAREHYEKVLTRDIHGEHFRHDGDFLVAVVDEIHFHLCVWIFIHSISKHKQDELATQAPVSSYIIKLNSTIAATQAQQRISLFRARAPANPWI